MSVSPASLVAAVLTFALLIATTDACTSVMIGPEATSDGSVWVGQSDDGEGDGDSRLVKVAAKTWPAGSMRPIVDYGSFPRYVGKERGIEAYYPSADLPNVTNNVIGHIPQVNHTYAYLEADYAISNEMGLAFGESTVSAKVFALNVAQGGPSLLSMYELTRLAAERCASSRCAIELMGSMAFEHGFYGDPEASTGGESVLVADSEEQWIFHVMAESEKTGSAVWAAQRIPRNHMTIVSNAWIIGDINATDTQNFAYSSNMHSLAKAKGWWDGEGSLHWTRTFSLGEYTSKYYAGRRMWGLYHALAPSLKTPAEYASYVKAIGDTYPVSAPPDSPVTQQDILTKVYRNYYQGTPYSLEEGPSSGPFGAPVRYKPGPAEGEMNHCTDQCSHWERPIASFRTTSIHQVNIRPSMPLEKRSVAWFLPGAALTGVFTPIYTSTTSAGMLGDGLNIKLNRETAFWAYKEMAQLVYPKWNHVKAALAEKSAELELAALNVVNTLDENPNVSASEMMKTMAMVQQGSVTKWQELYGEILVRWSDNWDYKGATSAEEPVGAATAIGYPTWWLKQVKYTGGTRACYPTCL